MRRFWTVAENAIARQDTAFVIVAVVVGMASGANYLSVALVGIGLVAVSSLLLWPRRLSNGWETTEGTLSLRIIPGEGVQAASEKLIVEAAERSRLTSAATARQGVALDLHLSHTFATRTYSPSEFVSQRAGARRRRERGELATGELHLKRASAISRIAYDGMRAFQPGLREVGDDRVRIVVTQPPWVCCRWSAAGSPEPWGVIRQFGTGW